MVLLIGPEDIEQIELKPFDVIKAVESAYKQDGLGKAEETPRLEIKIKGKDLPHISPGTTSIGQGMAYLEESGIFVTSYAYHFDFHKYINEIIDPETGKTLAIIKRTREPFGSEPKNIDSGMLRTGAAAAIGAKYMANKKVESVGIIGTGRVGRGSLICLNEVIEFEKVYTNSGRRRDDIFSKKMSKYVDADIISLDSIEDLVKKCDLLVTCTYAQKPIVKGEWLREGTHISGMGADGPLKSELDTDVFKKASKIVIDSQKCLSIGELSAALKSGSISMTDIDGKIGEVVAGKIPGRDNESDITIFESDGTHIQSGAVVYLIYQNAMKQGLGVELKDVSDFFINP